MRNGILVSMLLAGCQTAAPLGSGGAYTWDTTAADAGQADQDGDTGQDAGPAWQAAPKCSGYGCSQYGFCQDPGGTAACVAKTDGDCQQSQGCLDHGDCHFISSDKLPMIAKGGISINGQNVDANCQPTMDSDCTVAKSCKGWGACHLQGYSCVPTKPEDCSQSDICASAGECFLCKTGYGPSCQTTQVKSSGTCLP